MTVNYSSIVSYQSEQKIQLISINKSDEKIDSFPFGLCRICHDTASGVHYGVISCEGCKGFFKRCITQNVVYQCCFDNQCLINIDTRNRCRACRFKRCIAQGMSMDSVKMGRIPKKIKEKALRKYQKNQQALVSLDNLHVNLSSLRLPTIFYSASPLNFIKFPNNFSISDIPTSDINNNNVLTVTKYISKINENNIMQSFELHYSKKVLQIMKNLFPKLCQPFLLYELDFELMSFFRYIRLKTFDFYFKHTQRIRLLIQRMFGLINLDIKNYPGMHATYEQMWIGVQASIANHVKQFLDFAQNTPGLNELNSHDFTRILNNRVLDFWIILNYPLFYKNETYLMTPNGLQYTRYFMNKFIGRTTTDALHEFSQRLHSLNITQIEHSLIIPIVLCQPDEQFLDPETIHIIKHCYMYALYIQLCSTKTEEQAKILFDQILEILDHIRLLNEICKKNIGEIVLDKTLHSI